MTAAPTVLLLTDDLMGSDAHAAPGHPERPERAGPSPMASSQRRRGGGREAGAPASSRRPPTTSSSASTRPGILSSLDAAASRGGGWIDADTYLAPGLDAGVPPGRRRHARPPRGPPPGERPRSPSPWCGRRATTPSRSRRMASACSTTWPSPWPALRAEGLAQRIAIVDWDVHHGDGTQAIFDADAGPLLRLDPPVAASTRGRAARRSGARAPPSAPSTTSPCRRGAATAPSSRPGRCQLLPAVEAFAPEAILVSAGYDAHRDDPLAELEVTAEGYEAVAAALGELAARLGLRGVAAHAGGRLRPGRAARAAPPPRFVACSGAWPGEREAILASIQNSD